MSKIKSVSDLKLIADQHKDSLGLLNKPEDPDAFTQVKVAMATCSIAAGASRIYELLKEYIEKRGINAIVTKTGCMSYCYAEPTVEVKLPGKDPVVFGFVDEKKADEIVESYIKNADIPSGVIPVNYKTIEEINQ